MSELVITEKSNLVAIADAIREKGGTSDGLAFPEGFAEAIAAIEAGGKIFGTSKCEVGSVIATGGIHVVTPIPSWFSSADKLNVIAFTRSTYSWDAAYFTVLARIIRDTATLCFYSTNDTNNLVTTTLTVTVLKSDDKLCISVPNSVYTVAGCEYFYILWEYE